MCAKKREIFPVIRLSASAKKPPCGRLVDGACLQVVAGFSVGQGFTGWAY